MGWPSQACPVYFSLQVALVCSIFWLWDGDGDSAWAGDFDGFVLDGDDDDFCVETQVYLFDDDLFVQSQSAQVGEVQLESAIGSCQSGDHVDDVLAAFPFASVDDCIIVVILDGEDCSHCLEDLGGRVGPSRIVSHACQDGELVIELFGVEDVGGVLGDHCEAFPDEDGDKVGQSDVLEEVCSWGVFDSRVEVVPVGLREVDLAGSGSLLHDWGDQHIGTEKELCVCDLVDVGIGIQGEFEEEGPPDSAQSSLGDELLIHVFQEGVAEFQVLDCRLENCFSERVWFLRDGGLIIVIPGEGIDCAQLEPPGTEFSIGVSSESADIGSDHLEAEHLSIEVIGNGSLEEFPGGCVIACPVVPELTRAHGGAAGDDEGTQTLVFQELVGGVGFQEGTEDMDIRLGDIAVVGGVEGDGV